MNPQFTEPSTSYFRRSEATPWVHPNTERGARQLAAGTVRRRTADSSCPTRSNHARQCSPSTPSPAEAGGKAGLSIVGAEEPVLVGAAEVAGLVVVAGCTTRRRRAAGGGPPAASARAGWSAAARGSPYRARLRLGPPQGRRGEGWAAWASFGFTFAGWLLGGHRGRRAEWVGCSNVTEPIFRQPVGQVGGGHERQRGR